MLVSTSFITQDFTRPLTHIVLKILTFLIIFSTLDAPMFNFKNTCKGKKICEKEGNLKQTIYEFINPNYKGASTLVVTSFFDRLWRGCFCSSWSSRQRYKQSCLGFTFKSKMALRSRRKTPFGPERQALLCLVPTCVRGAMLVKLPCFG